VGSAISSSHSPRWPRLFTNAFMNSSSGNAYHGNSYHALEP
jgi:hypothetical protein